MIGESLRSRKDAVFVDAADADGVDNDSNVFKDVSMATRRWAEWQSAKLFVKREHTVLANVVRLSVVVKSVVPHSTLGEAPGLYSLF